MNIKQNKGIGSTDALIAVVILMIFTGIIATISSNIYNQSQFIKRNERATDYIVEVFEYAQSLLYDQVNSTKLVEYINNKQDNAKAIAGIYSDTSETLKGYTIFINVQEQYNDYVKQIDITAVYKLRGKNKIVNMSTLISK